MAKSETRIAADDKAIRCATVGKRRLADEIERRNNQIDRLKDLSDPATRDIEAINETAWNIEALQYVWGTYDIDLAPDNDIESLRGIYEGCTYALVDHAGGYNMGTKHYPQSYWRTLHEEWKRIRFALERVDHLLRNPE